MSIAQKTKAILEWNTRAPPSFPDWEINELAKERDALKAELEAARNQKPCGWQSQFTAIGENWGPCSKEHYETVMSDTSAYPGYEVRQVYASPVPAQKATKAYSCVYCGCLELEKVTACHCLPQGAEQKWNEHMVFPALD